MCYRMNCTLSPICIWPTDSSKTLYLGFLKLLLKCNKLLRNEGYIHEFGSGDSKGRMACFECIPAKFMLKRLMGHKGFFSNGIKAFKRAINIVQLFCPSVTSVRVTWVYPSQRMQLIGATIQMGTRPLQDIQEMSKSFHKTFLRIKIWEKDT